MNAAITGTPTKTYDSTTTARLTSGNFALSGFVGSQGATVAALTGAYNSPDVTTANTVSATLVAPEFTANAGTSFSNYTLPTAASGAGAISAAALTAAIAGTPPKIYDGTTAAALASGNFALSGFVGSQGAAVSPLTGSYNSPDVAAATTVSAPLARRRTLPAMPATLFGNYTLPTSASRRRRNHPGEAARGDHGEPDQGL